jgi:hypothetical protein
MAWSQQLGSSMQVSTVPAVQHHQAVVDVFINMKTSSQPCPQALDLTLHLSPWTFCQPLSPGKPLQSKASVSPSMQ